MYLDSAEEKMLRAIVRSAVAEAAAGRPFRGTFRGILITARGTRGDEHGIAQIEARILWLENANKNGDQLLPRD
jgi:hypothetical protein